MEGNEVAIDLGMDLKTKIRWAISILLPIGIMFLPTTDMFTSDIRTFFAITLWAIFMFAFEILDTTVTALILPFAYVMSGLSNMSTAFGPWGQSVPWVTLGGFLLANILERTGLLKRMAYGFILKTDGTYKGIVYGLVTACIFINIIQPGSSPIAIAALTYGICKALNLERSRASAGIMIAGAIGTISAGFFVYTPGNLGVLFEMASNVQPMKVSFLDYFKQNIVFIPLMYILAFMITRVMKPEEEIDGKDYFKKQCELLGPMTSDEKKTTLSVSFLLIYLLTANIHKLDMAFGFILFPAMLFLPFFNVGEKDDIERLNFSFLIFITGCMSIGAVATTLGVGELISHLVLPYMKQVGPVALIAIVWILGVGINFILTPLAAMATLGGPLVQIASDLNISAYPIMYAFFQGLDQLILPYEYALYLIFFSFGMIHIKDFMKVFAWKMLISGIYLILIGVPYWKLIGLL